MKKVTGPDAGTLYAMKVLKKASLKGILFGILGVEIGRIFHFSLLMLFLIY